MRLQETPVGLGLHLWDWSEPAGGDSGQNSLDFGASLSVAESGRQVVANGGALVVAEATELLFDEPIVESEELESNDAGHGKPGPRQVADPVVAWPGRFGLGGYACRARSDQPG